MLNDVNGDLVFVPGGAAPPRRVHPAVPLGTDQSPDVRLAPGEQAQHLTDIQRAARFFYLQKLAFGGKVDGQTYGTSTTAPTRLNLLRLEEDLSAAHLRLHQVNIENLDWHACITRYDREHTLFFCDPPYYGTEGYGVEFGLEQYDRMAELLRTMKGKAAVTVNDIPAMRQAFKGWP